MTTLSASDMARDEACIPRLDRYREAPLREVMEANRPRLLNTISTVQTALAETPKVKEKP